MSRNPNDDFDDILMEIAKKIYGKVIVDGLGLKLGFTAAEIARYIQESARGGSYGGILHMLRTWSKGQSTREQRGNLKAALEKTGLNALADEYLSADDLGGSTGLEFPQKKEAGQGPSRGQTVSQEPKATIDQPLLDERPSKLRCDVTSGGMDQHSEEVSHPTTADLDGPFEDLSSDGKQVRWDFLTDSPELTLKDDEVVISCGIRFWPSGAKLSEPFMVTLDHNAHFTDPSLAEIVFYTRNKDSNTFKRIPASTDGCPARCVVRSKDLDFYVDHFCDWWIVTRITRIFVGKRVECAPYVMKRRTPFVILCIYDDLPRVLQRTNENMQDCRRLCPPHQMFVQWKFGDIKIELFGGPKGNEKKIEKTVSLSTRDMNLVERKQFSFEVESLESGASQNLFTFAWHQSRCPSEPTLIRFSLSYDDVPTAPAAGAASGTMPASPQAARVSPLSGQMIREEGDQVEPDGDGYYKQTMKQANPSQGQLDPKKNYKMDAVTKGHMFILNMTKKRRGSDVDVRNVKHVFKEIGYKMEIHSDLTAKDLKHKLQKFVDSPDHKGMCSVVFFFMGHGTKKGTGIQCKLGGKDVVPTKYIVKQVSRMKSMDGRPKMVFFQCCRGKGKGKKVEIGQDATDKAIPAKSDVSKDDSTTDAGKREMVEIGQEATDKAIPAKSDVSTDDSTTDEDTGTEEETDDDESDLSIPAESDVFTIDATKLGNKAYRSTAKGSWFIQTLCKVLLENAHDTDLSTMLEQVVGEVGERGSKDKAQVPRFDYQGVSKKMYFLPKYSSRKA